MTKSRHQKKQGHHKRFSFKKKYFIGCAGLGLAACMLLSQPRWLFSLATHLFPGALYAVDSPKGEPTTQKRIALTIDDGPSPATADILAVLAQYNVKATFFNISGHLAGYEAIAQQTVAAGHELGNHLTADAPSIRLSPQAFEGDLLTAERALLPFLQNTERQNTEPITDPNLTLQWLRPGMGFYNAEMVKTAENHNYQIVLGSHFPYDTHIHSSRFASAFILRTIQPGDIIVLHDGGESRNSEANTRGDHTVQTLKTILPALQAQGYEITTVSELVTLAQ